MRGWSRWANAKTPTPAFPRWEARGSEFGDRKAPPYLPPISLPDGLFLSPLPFQSLPVPSLPASTVHISKTSSNSNGLSTSPVGSKPPLWYAPPLVKLLVPCVTRLLTTRARLPTDPPDSITIPEFIFSEKYGRKPLSRSRSPYTCGITGKSYTTAEVEDREKLLARALAKRLGYDLNEGTEWDRVIALYSLNTVRVSRAVA